MGLPPVCGHFADNTLCANQHVEGGPSVAGWQRQFWFIDFPFESSAGGHDYDGNTVTRSKGSHTAHASCQERYRKPKSIVGKNSSANKGDYSH